MNRVLCLLLLCASLYTSAFSQNNDRVLARDWFLKDPVKDTIPGTGVDRAYAELLSGRPSVSVVVAVIDSGVDVDHEDLKGAVWVNEDEIPGNGIDDDKNGYADDVNGWNFIGGKEGNVDHDLSEVAREYIRLKARFEGVSGSNLRGRKKKEYTYYRQLKENVESQREDNEKNLTLYGDLYDRSMIAIKELKKALDTDTLTFRAVSQFMTEDPMLLQYQSHTLSIFENAVGPKGNPEDFVRQLKEAKDHFEGALKYVYNESFDPRYIVGDRYDDPYERYYGNNTVEGPGADHGSHVAGIIGADRHNDKGMRGIVEKVKIMSVRTVPNGGDERDKDVANAIRYAADNGAKVINMSFGKSLSPEKKTVDKAVRYAKKKGVLMVHAAGNEGKNNDENEYFPTRYYGMNRKKSMPFWIEVGASSWSLDRTMIPSFSNYGKKEVDVFAPGVDIFSTTPDNHYATQGGTSMAAPMVSGVAALLFSYFPTLNAAQVKSIIRSTVQRYDDVSVFVPGDKTGKETVELDALSATGGIVNAYKAVKRALQVTAEK